MAPTGRKRVLTKRTGFLQFYLFLASIMGFECKEGDNHVEDITSVHSHLSLRVVEMLWKTVPKLMERAFANDRCRTSQYAFHALVAFSICYIITTGIPQRCLSLARFRHSFILTFLPWKSSWKIKHKSTIFSQGFCCHSMCTSEKADGCAIFCSPALKPWCSSVNAESWTRRSLLLTNKGKPRKTPEAAERIENSVGQRSKIQILFCCQSSSFDK